MRRTATTLLLVCEGDAEIQFARVIRDAYLSRSCGVNLRSQNGHGYGGARTLSIAIDQKKRTSFDRYGVIIDTDTHWGASERALAASHRIICIENTPCLESTLLAVDGHPIFAETASNKRAFRKRYGQEAHHHGVIEKNFDRAKFDAARNRVAAINAILAFMNC